MFFLENLIANLKIKSNGWFHMLFGWGIRNVMIHGQGYYDIEIEALI
jgi:hypothetical protein